MDRITLIDGRSFRVEVNWNAIVAFLEASNRDDIRALADLSMLKPSDLAGLLAAGINEGARLDGAQERVTAEEVGTIADVGVMAEFIAIFTRQTKPKGEPDAGKKG